MGSELQGAKGKGRSTVSTSVVTWAERTDSRWNQEPFQTSGVCMSEQERVIKDGVEDSGLSTRRVMDPNRKEWTSFSLGKC